MMLDRDETRIKGALGKFSHMAVDTAQLERKIKQSMRDRSKYAPRRKAGVFVAASIMLMLFVAGSVYATAGNNSNFLRTFFRGHTHSFEEFVQAPGTSAADERYVLTVEQTLVTAHQALIIYSVEALTDDAIAELNATDAHGFCTFMGMDTIDFGPVNRQANINNGGRLMFGGWSTMHLDERRTETKRYFAITVTNMLNEDAEDFFIRLNKMADPQKVIISMRANIAAHEFVLACSSGDNAVLRFTPLGINLERTISTSGDLQLNIIDGLFFRKACGEVNSFSQLLIKYGITLVEFPEEPGGYLRYEMSALFREIMSVSEFASIILDGVEYDINDLSVTKPFVIDQTMQPFELQPYYRGHLWVPIEELCQIVGADFYWNREENYAIVEYRNSSFVLRAGSTIILKNGDTIDFFNEFDCDATFVSDDGRLIVSSRLLDLMGIGIVPMNMDANGNILPVRDWVWTIIP